MYGDKKFQCANGDCGAGDCYNCNPKAYDEKRCDGCNGKFYAYELDQNNLCDDCKDKIKCDHCGEWSRFNYLGMCEDCLIEFGVPY